MKIKLTNNKSIREFAKEKRLDYTVLIDLLSGRVSGKKEGSKANKIKEFLEKNDLIIYENDLTLDISNVKNSILKEWYSYKLKELKDKKFSPKECIYYFRRKTNF